jgi:hypothetical protein
MRYSLFALILFMHVFYVLLSDSWTLYPRQYVIIPLVLGFFLAIMTIPEMKLWLKTFFSTLRKG